MRRATRGHNIQNPALKDPYDARFTWPVLYNNVSSPAFISFACSILQKNLSGLCDVTANDQF